MNFFEHCCLFAALIVLGLLSQVGAPGPKSARIFKRIVRGEEAEPNKWPWQGLLLQLRTDGTNTYSAKCGVVLIDTEWVVTTAACVFNAERSTLKVVLGEHVRSENEGTEQEFQVSIIHMHRRVFTDKGYAYNIAILKLSSPATITNAVKVIKLPEAGEQVQVGKKCYMTGWGSTEFGEEKSNTLQQAKLPVVSYEDCKLNEQLGYSIVDDFSMFCAGHGKKLISGCDGDAGGAFSCKKNGKWILQGISSWGDHHCGGVYYSIMTRMSSFVDWIKDQMQAPPLEKPTSCIDTHSYCQAWKDKGWCNMGYSEMMLKEYYCKKTCDAC